MSTRREEILRIAGALFARKGFTATSIRDIAEEAGILPGSLYSHFDSKEAIAREILTGYYVDLLDRYRALVKQQHQEADALGELIREGFRGIQDQQDAMALMRNSGELLLDNERFAELRTLNSELKQIWLKVIKAGIRKGAFRSDTDPKLLRRFIRDNLAGAASWWRPGGAFSVDQIADRFVAMIYAGVLADPAPGNAATSSPSTMAKKAPAVIKNRTGRARS
jgi:TetR/AcrR family transcriptional regulator, cholesterol catabolism regulator